MEGVIILLVFAVVIILGVPIGNAIGIATVVGYLLLRNSLIIIPQKMFMGVNSFTYLCIPFFVLASDIMTDGGITRAILNFCDKFIGHICGGLAHVNVVASAFFAGITGSATADAVGLGKLEIDMMREAGYPDDFSAGITAASAILGPIIPPSNSMILYATIAGNIPVVMLFLGGIVPGLIIAALLMAYCYYVSKKKKYPVTGKRAKLKDILRAFISCFPALLMPIIILGGILSGLFTATESAAIAIVYAVFVTKFVYRTFNYKKFILNLINAAKTTCVVYFIIAISSAMGWVITVLRVPQTAAAFVLTFADSAFTFLIFANLLLLVIGMLLDLAPAVMIMAPILIPIAVSYGVDPLHFGIIVCINLTIGLISPPIGMTLFVTSGVANITLERMYKAIIPFFLVEAVALAVITFCPDMVLFIPRLMGYGG